MKNTLTVVALFLSITGIVVSLAREELRCRLGLAEECISSPPRLVLPGPSLESTPTPELRELKPEPSPPRAEATTPSESPSPLPSPEPTPEVESVPSPSPTVEPSMQESPTPAPETAIPIPVLPPSPDS